MTDKQGSKKKIPKGLPRPYETVDTVRHGSALAEIVRYQSPLGSVHHVYRPKRVWESMTTTKEDTSELIFPNYDSPGLSDTGGASPFEPPAFAGSVYATMDNFAPIAPPETEGDFVIEDNVLKFVATSMAGLAGDYNQDGVVDAADYTVWRDNLGSDESLPNDDTPGVGADDYARWKTNFGQIDGGAAADFALQQAVPEPTGFSLWLLGMLLLGYRSASRRARR